MDYFLFAFFQTFVDYVTTVKFNNVMDEEKRVDETYSRLLQVVWYMSNKSFTNYTHTLNTTPYISSNDSMLL